MGTLYLVSTPIGNIDDITIRAMKTLSSVTVIACEDTRQSGQLFSILRERYPMYMTNGSQRLISYHDKNEENMIPELIGLLQEGTSIAVVSDAGTPLVSDPGYRLVQAAIKRDIPVVPIPGVSAIFPALQVSGFPVNTFLFIGYLPEKQSHRMAMLAHLKANPDMPTVVSYCAPHKLATTLEDIQSVFGSDKVIAIARELTKIHENVWRGTVAEAKNQGEFKGELVLVF